MMEGAYKVAMDDLKEVRLAGASALLFDLISFSQMYCGRVTMEILDRRWAKDAIFEDPWLLCKGFDQYAPHWLSIVSASFYNVTPLVSLACIASIIHAF